MIFYYLTSSEFPWVLFGLYMWVLFLLSARARFVIGLRAVKFAR
jgi:hypothetical protein